ncbi:luciferase family oxidoreductase, group 1 [Paramicrobacterium humi]|uniref:Luciferase family oxidoreductase, group 1 n=1 Tax=Paramicrobacterium humi TaxID=640635 RepID=A0A1H4PNL0_9MICO|nr:LLM class flavin-dependent oxidoreductase [Microbacterium humi]SEC08782.1 luciferase family oxidoreductase, group 1 [Microbacterium humi]
MKIPQRGLHQVMKLSVLDLVPVRTGQNSAQALAASVRLAQRADALGYTRYWVAEHHNMPSVASTNPAVIIALLASRTTNIRVGSGGVMLPNHAPLVVAEQFALLEAAAPGRIDLGIGRAPGSDPVVTAVLNQSGATSDVNRFPNNVSDIIALLGPDGAAVQLTSGKEYPLRSTPAAAGTPEVWLLGSSDYSAGLAASFGLPYVFANHFSGQGAERALEIYRSGFEPSAYADKPRTFMTANAVVAATADEAYALALPNLQHMARLRTNKPLGMLATVEDAEREQTDALTEEFIQQAVSRYILGDPASAARQAKRLAEQHGVDELMISPVAGSFDADPLDQTPARERTLELLAAELDLTA